MGKAKTTVLETLKDVLLGYGVVVLSIMCFIIAMWALIAIVRIILIGQ